MSPADVLHSQDRNHRPIDRLRASGFLGSGDAGLSEQSVNDVNYVWGIGVHSHDMGGAMLPEMMRWLWRDHPVSVDPNDTIERSFRTGKPAAPSAAPPPGANPAGAR